MLHLKNCHSVLMVYSGSQTNALSQELYFSVVGFLVTNKSGMLHLKNYQSVLMVNSGSQTNKALFETLHIE